jgi:hypothetical protein
MPIIPAVAAVMSSCTRKFSSPNKQRKPTTKQAVVDAARPQVSHDLDAIEESILQIGQLQVVLLSPRRILGHSSPATLTA